MHKKLWLIVVAVFMWSIANACDVCGGGLGGNFIGIAAQTSNTMIGLRFTNSTLHTNHKAIFRDEHNYISFENYSTANIWTRFYLNKYIQVFTFIPIHYFYRKEEGKITQNAGVGDATIRLHYLVFNNFDKRSCGVKQSLQLGLGLKLPTGYHLKKQNDVLLPVGMQMGSGSVDFPLAIIYNIRMKSIGMNLESTYTFNTKNNQDYRFGDKWNNTLTGYYWIQHNRLNYIPKINAELDWYQQDYKQKYSQTATGGLSAKLGVGFAVFLEKVSIDASFTLPIYENLNRGLTKTKSNLSIQFIYLI